MDESTKYWKNPTNIYVIKTTLICHLAQQAKPESSTTSTKLFNKLLISLDVCDKLD